MQNCPICNNQQNKQIGEKDGFSVLRCKHCKSLFVYDLLTKSRIPSSYDHSYSEGARALEIPEFTHRVLDSVVAKFDVFRQNNRLLDVGCGAGTFLAAAERAKWQAEGVEVSSSSVEYVKSQGLKVFHGTLEEANYPDNYFDVVVAVEVIEHILDPQPVIKEVLRVLRPGGLFWGSTPHSNGISAKMIGKDWSAVCPPDHLHLFSVFGITDMFQKAGFSEVKASTHGVNPYEILNIWRKRILKESTAKNQENTSNNELNVLESSYKLNETLMKSNWRQSVKGFMNGALNITRLGDSLKFWAIK